MSRAWLRRWSGPVAGAAILLALVWQLGTGPFLDGLEAVDPTSILLAALIAVPTTVCCAWRWRTVGRGLGVDVPLGTGTAFYYRSQFLNMVLPGGVLGDVHRAVAHGRAQGDVGRSARAVVWERAAGQAVQVVLTVSVLLVLPSPVDAVVPAVAVALMVATALAVLLARSAPRDRPTWVARAVVASVDDVRAAVLAPQAWPRIALASLVVVAGHTTTFVIAARAVGVSVDLRVLVPLALLVLVAMTLPTSIGGWGLREGAAAWAFAAAGLGADAGVATAVTYGVLTLIAALPGLVVLIVSARAAHRPTHDVDVRTPTDDGLRSPSADPAPEGVAHG
jgi:glycosyltransferase 2 family protein